MTENEIDLTTKEKVEATVNIQSFRYGASPESVCVCVCVCVLKHLIHLP